MREASESHAQVFSEVSGISSASGPSRYRATLFRTARLGKDATSSKNRAVALAKLSPLSTVSTGVLGADYDAGADGACPTCGVRPATISADDVKRCAACHDEHELGSRLPNAAAVVWSDGRLPDKLAGGGPSVEMPCGLHLAVLTDAIRADDRAAWRRVISGYRLPEAEASHAGGDERTLCES